jgi:RNA polymerase sigma-70 factor, ECF subfamily
MEGDMQEPDPQTVSAARRGELGAFEDLVRLYQADVWRFSYHLLRDEQMADDVSQDALVRAYRFLDRYRGDSKFSTWLFSITRNCALDELRRVGRRKRLAERIEAPEPGLDQTVAVEVREAVHALPLELREPVVLIDMFGSSYREVAQMLGVPEGTIKSRMHRARELLAVSLRPLDERTHEA